MTTVFIKHLSNDSPGRRSEQFPTSSAVEAEVEGDGADEEPACLPFFLNFSQKWMMTVGLAPRPRRPLAMGEAMQAVALFGWR
ncbi:MAG: hypothetical protein U5N86_01760 [Planctomycetota bacterium]|nr:hypothetical protein [Planctomycetota bacterium]